MNQRLTVGELIERLKAYPHDLPLVVGGEAVDQLLIIVDVGLTESEDLPALCVLIAEPTQIKRTR